MRKLIPILFFTLCLTFAGLAKTKKHIPDYFPVVLNGEWHFVDNLKNESKNVITEVKDGIITMTTTSAGSESKTYYKKTGGFVYILKSETPAYNYTADYEPDRNELMNPLVIGKSWEWKGTAGGMNMSQTWKAVGTEKVTVPAGTFTAVKVEADGDMAGTKPHYTYWYVDGIGSVKVVAETNGATSTTELVKYIFPKRK